MCSTKYVQSFARWQFALNFTNLEKGLLHHSSFQSPSCPIPIASSIVPIASSIVVFDWCIDECWTFYLAGPHVLHTNLLPILDPVEGLPLLNQQITAPSTPQIWYSSCVKIHRSSTAVCEDSSNVLGYGIIKSRRTCLEQAFIQNWRETLLRVNYNISHVTNTQNVVTLAQTIHRYIITA